MQSPKRKSSFLLWLPFGLRRIDSYYAGSYLKILTLIIVALAALIGIGDLFQRFDDFVMLSRREEHELTMTIELFARYYGTFVPQLIFQYMLPMTMLLAASIAATSSYAGPRGNNEYTVIRSSGVPVLRAFVPLVLPALVVAIAFQAGRDFFLPAMVRESNAITNRLKSRISNPTSLSLMTPEGFQTVAMGWFSPAGESHNLILEIRDPEKFHRGDPARGDNDFQAYRAAAARLEPRPDGDGYQWTPLENGAVQTFTHYARRETPWTEPIPTSMTPAMIERQTLGDAVCTWSDLAFLQKDNASAKFEFFWRLSDPLACALLIVWGTGICMGRMLRGREASYIQSIALSMIAAGIFYGIRLAGKSMWEQGMLTPVEGVWYPVAAIAALTLPIALWIER